MLTEHDQLNLFGVASLAEAWIEIFVLPPESPLLSVASLAEAWIEILTELHNGRFYRVASLAEAWIEIAFPTHPFQNNQSPPSRRRGLKYHVSGL